MITRRCLLLAAVAPAAAALTLAESPEAKAAASVPKALADYQNRPHDGRQCDGCCMFIPGTPDRCTMIEGPVSPEGWCKYYQHGRADTCS